MDFHDVAKMSNKDLVAMALSLEYEYGFVILCKNVVESENLEPRDSAW